MVVFLANDEHFQKNVEQPWKSLGQNVEQMLNNVEHRWSLPSLFATPRWWADTLPLDVACSGGTHTAQRGVPCVFRGRELGEADAGGALCGAQRGRPVRIRAA